MHEQMWYAAELEPGTVMGGWRLLKRLGVGGYGAVYHAESVEHPDTFCALKVFLNPRDARVGREAALLLDKAVHPNVVRCHGIGHWPHPTQGRAFLVLEYVPGLPLHLWAEERNPDFTRLARVGAETALALGQLHARGVLHRDLKPEHLLVRESNERPVLVDFGVGDYEGAGTLTETPLPPGTAHLRSPEAACFWLARGDKPRERYAYGPADELYALGVCLYRALTGHYPFPAGAEVKTLLYLDIAHRVPAAPVDVNSRVPLALSDIVMRLLAKRPEERYRTGAEVHAALVAAYTFGGREPWEASVFEWEEAPEAEASEGVTTARRRIRRPPLPPAQEKPASPAPPTPPAPPRRIARWLLWAAALVGVVGLLALLVGPHISEFQSTRQVATHNLPARVQEVATPVKTPDTAPAAAPQPSAEVKPAATAQPVRHKDDVPVKQNKNSPIRSQSEQTPISVEETSSSAWRSALLICLLQGGAACAGVPVRPKPEDCSAAALADMKSLGITPSLDEALNVWLDVTKPLARGLDNFTDGRVISSVEESLYGLPEGSLLYGWLYVTGNGVNKWGQKKIYGRWDKAKLPDGRELSVCFVLANPDGADEVEPGPPTYARLPRGVPLIAVKRFVFEPSKEW
jgi:serine/threonine-protein kinase